MVHEKEDKIGQDKEMKRNQREIRKRKREGEVEGRQGEIGCDQSDDSNEEERINHFPVNIPLYCELQLRSVIGLRWLLSQKLDVFVHECITRNWLPYFLEWLHPSTYTALSSPSDETIGHHESESDP